MRQAGRDGETTTVTTLADLDPESRRTPFTVVLIGTHAIVRRRKHLRHAARILPRDGREEGGVNFGQGIMIESFRTIERELKHPRHPARP